jgi:hypothetical protein
MTPADQASKNAISLEAKKDALAQRQNGDWKVSFTVQGIDMDTRLTQAPMGTRYAVVLVEIGDDELPVAAKETAAKPRQKLLPDAPTGGAKREKIDWREVQPAAQAAMQCDKPVFWAFLNETHGYGVDDPAGAAHAVREICGVKSRSELGTNHKARILWKCLDDQFQAWRALEHA